MIPLPTGALPSPPGDDIDFRDLYAHAGVVRPIVTVDCRLPHEQRVQGQPSCVGYTVATQMQDFDAKLWALNRNVHVRLPNGTLDVRPRRTLPQLPPLSGHWHYTLGRWIEAKLAQRVLGPEGLPNTGSSYRLNIMGLRDVENGGGCRAETDWPDIPENATRIPPAHVITAEPHVSVGGYYRIFGERDVDRLREGWLEALHGYELGENSKPGAVMDVGQVYAQTPEGSVYDDVAAGELAEREPATMWGGHAQQGCGYDATQDALVLHSTWPGQSTFRVRAQHMADRGREFWVLSDLIYIPRAE